MDDFQGATDRFLTWFKSVGGEFRDDLLQITDLRSRDAGRGIIAIKDISQDTTLFTIPRSAIINIETSELPKKLPKVFQECDGGEDENFVPLDSWGSLILVMLYEYLQGEASRWKPYLDVLPENFDTPIFWSETELKELEGTCLTTDKIGKQESDDMLRSRIVSVVLQNPTIFYTEGADPFDEEYLLHLAHRMGSTIMAYAFDLENDAEKSEDEEEGWVEDREGLTLLGMVPMADILNANADFNVHVNHGDVLEVNSLRADIAIGTEILNYYGPLPSSELLRRYGYVTSEHHRYDVAEVPWSSITSALCSHLGIDGDTIEKIQLELEEDDVIEEYFTIERDSGDPTSEGRLTYPAKLREISPELGEQMEAFLRRLKDLRPDIFVVRRKREEISNTVLATVLNQKLAQYHTTAVEDKALLERGDLRKRHRMAVEVRLGEKQLLHEALALVEENEVGRTDFNSEPAKKKTKT